MATREHVLDIARAQVNITESPANSNCQKFSKDLGRPCEAWCADSVVWIMRQAGIKLPSESAYTPSMYNGFVNAGTAVKDIAHGLQPGDVIFFDFVSPFTATGIQHVGIFVSYADAGHANTLEGNTSSGDSGSQSNGGGYFSRVRPLSFIVGAGRPPYDANPPAPLPVPAGVTPEYDPPLHIEVVSGAGRSDGPGGWLLGKDGAIFSFAGASYKGGPNGQDYWGNRTARLLQEKDNGGYRVLSTLATDGGYDYPGGGNVIADGPQFDVVLNVVADLAAPGGGFWILQQDGSIFTFGAAQYHGGANGQDYFAGRKAARLEPHGAGYDIISTSGERYQYAA